jgi:hypothetical protein
VEQALAVTASSGKAELRAVKAALTSAQQAVGRVREFIEAAGDPSEGDPTDLP